MPIRLETLPARRPLRTLSSFLLLILAAAALPAAEGTFEKTLPVPRDSDARLGWTHQGCTVTSLTLRNYPDREDIEEARRTDPGDKSWLWWEFNVANRSERKCSIALSIQVFDRKGNVVKSGDRSDSVSPESSTTTSASRRS